MPTHERKRDARLLYSLCVQKAKHLNFLHKLWLNWLWPSYSFFLFLLLLLLLQPFTWQFFYFSFSLSHSFLFFPCPSNDQRWSTSWFYILTSSWWGSSEWLYYFKLLFRHFCPHLHRVFPLIFFSSLLIFFHLIVTLSWFIRRFCLIQWQDIHFTSKRN